MAEVTYYVALPFVLADDGVAPGEAVDCTSANAAVMRAEARSRKPGWAGALAFCRTGDPATGEFGDAQLIRKFGEGTQGWSALGDPRSPTVAATRSCGAEAGCGRGTTRTEGRGG